MNHKKFIPFSNRLEHSLSRFGTGVQFAGNVLPVYNGFRAVEDLEDLGEIASNASGINGSFQHIYLADTSTQKTRALSTFDVEEYNRQDNMGHQPGNFLNLVVDEVSPDTLDYVVAGGANEAAEIKFAVAPYSTPGSTSNWKFRAAYKIEGNSGGTAELTYTLYDDDGETVLDGPTTIYSSADDTGGWKFFEDTFTGNLAWSLAPVVGFNSSTFGDPQIVVPVDEDNIDSWENELGSTVSIGASIDEGETPDDDDYIVSPVLGTTGSTVYYVKLFGIDNFLAIPTEDPNGVYAPSLFIRWKRPQAGTYFDVGIYQGHPEAGGEFIFGPEFSFHSYGTFNGIEAQDTYTTTDDALSLVFPAIENFTDLSDVWAKITFYAGDPEEEDDIYTGEYVYDEADPVDTNLNGDGSFAEWVDHTEDSNDIHLDCDEGSDAGDTTTFIQPDVGGFGSPQLSRCVLDLGPVEDRGHFTGSTLHFRAKTTTPTSASLAFKLYRDSIPILDSSVTVTTSITNISVPVSAAALQAAADNNQTLYLELTDQATSQGTRQVYSAWIEVPKPSRLYISNLYLTFPPRSYAAIAWFELETPAAEDQTLDDKGIIYAGDLETLWLVDDNWEFNDVSISGGYNTGSLPKAWRFAQWGNDVIATNYADPVQIRLAATGDFDDMITSTKKPRARDVITVLDFVMLLNTAGEAEAGPDVIWWSAIDDAHDFDPDITTQCDFQALKDTPGQIMCGVGGEYGIIFKQTAIYRVEYVGSPIVFNRFLLSNSVGTPYPASVVPVGRDIYFHDGSRFRVLRNGQELDQRFPSEVNKFLGDKKHEDFALIPSGDTLLSPADSTVQGIYDSQNNLIWWLIKTKYSIPADDGEVDPPTATTAHNVIVVYDVADERFTVINGEAHPDLSEPVELVNQYMYLTNLLGLKSYYRDNLLTAKPVVAFKHLDGTHYVSQFSADVNRNVKVSTGVFSIEDVSCNIHSIRPIYTVDTQEDAIDLPRAGIKMTIESADNPSMIFSNEVESEDQNDEGWFMLRNSGSYHDVTFEMTAPVNTLRELIGVEVEYSAEGLR